jgi:DNA polymerase
MATAEQLRRVLRDTVGLLQAQAQLGLRGLDVPTETLLPTESPAPDGSTTAALRRPGGSAQDPAAAGTGTEIASRKASSPSARDRPTLRHVHERLGDCRRCKLCRGRNSIVFGAGNPQARLMFVGEGPGLDEDLQGEPFVGAAGKQLDRMIAAMGLKRSQVYIANVVKCRPPRNRDPEPDEVAACEPFLRQQIRAVCPEVIVALGRVAAQVLLRDTAAISRLRGQWRRYDGVPLMPTFHPAYLLRSPEGKKPAWLDLQAVMAKLGLSDPRTAG